ncbi:uncharacterized protein F5Z01DRAFT_256802 [Emericellopsis atlantica]|uniref:Uncharacterized protein n=1 Tax=Emericellopsis atlantica TaxID=2614577 RepID=A0A9P8CMA7_9HYPO|nr:uncharacterized protein F5Z01DRAFT_256802 [Emericellopsis atlantica]KAG9251907.1 hypothetical protein F5Z01DRAFT_256802 [Emericellopsis atlantica]
MDTASSPSDSPPTYSSLGPSESDAAIIEKEWTRFCPKDKYEQWKKKPNLIFEFNSPDLMRDPHHGWRAQLLVHDANIPKLMRKGFSLTSAHFSHAESSISLKSRLSIALSLSLCHARIFFFRRPASELGCYGKVIVWSRSRSTIVNFDLKGLRRDTVTKVDGWNVRNAKVYQFRSDPKACFNAIYAQMPLEGWWPWPKAPSTRVAVRSGEQQLKTTDNQDNH